MSFLSIWDLGLSRSGVLATLSSQFCLPSSLALPKLRSGLWTLSGFGVAFQPLILVSLPTWEIPEGKMGFEGGLRKFPPSLLKIDI